MSRTRPAPPSGGPCGSAPSTSAASPHLLDGLELRDPAGHACSARSARAFRIQPLALKAHRIVLTEARRQKPWIEIAKIPGSAETTSNAHPAAQAAAAAADRSKWSVDVRSLGCAPVPSPCDRLGADSDVSLRTWTSDRRMLLRGGLRRAALKRLPCCPRRGGADRLELTSGSTAPQRPGPRPPRRSAEARWERLAASGSWDLGPAGRRGPARANWCCCPQDLELASRGANWEVPVRGEADLKSDGKTAHRT